MTYFAASFKDHEYVDILDKEYPFYLPKAHDLETTGFIPFFFEDEGDKQHFSGAMFVKAQKGINKKYLDFLAKEAGASRKPDRKEFYIKYMEENLAVLKPAISYYPVIHHKESDLLIIDANTKMFEHIVDNYFGTVSEYVVGGMRLSDMYMEPPGDYEYNSAIEFIDTQTEQKITICGVNWDNVKVLAKNAKYVVNKLRFITDFGNTFMVDTNAHVTNVRITKDCGIGLYDQLQEIFAAIKPYQIGKKTAKKQIRPNDHKMSESQDSVFM
jgi:hypothetical protein